MQSYEHLRVLVFEPDPALRGILCDIFSGEGHTVSMCGSLLELIAQASGGPGEVGVVDLGWFATHPLGRRGRLGLSRLNELVPLVLLESEPVASSQDSSDLADLPAITKPFDISALVASIQYAASSHEVAQAPGV